MSSTRSQRIQANCEIIWGSGLYDVDVETDDWLHYMAHVKEDRGTSYGPPLTMTGLCRSRDRAWAELDRMLCLWAAQKQSGRPMTKEQRLDIFGGPGGKHMAVLEAVFEQEARIRRNIALAELNRTRRAAERTGPAAE